MKLIALHHENGKILAAAILDDRRPGPVPVASASTRAVTLDVPPAHRNLDLVAICTRLRVDPRTNQLIET